MINPPTEPAIRLWNFRASRRAVLGALLLTIAVLGLLFGFTVYILATRSSLPVTFLLFDIVGPVLLLPVLGLNLVTGRKLSPQILQLYPDSVTLTRKSALGKHVESRSTKWDRVAVTSKKIGRMDSFRLRIPDERAESGAWFIWIPPESTEQFRQFIDLHHVRVELGL